MKEITRLKTDVDCGWRDDVGSSITSYALVLASVQEQACSALVTVMTAAEQAVSKDISYKSNAAVIKACYVK
ncbi:MAG: hypothetical protein IJX39_05370 [Clostridia bacterium]|nr:hypothetical protein [Clostridia bacterium]